MAKKKEVGTIVGDISTQGLSGIGNKIAQDYIDNNKRETAGSTVPQNTQNGVQPLDKSYDPFVDLNPEYLANMDMNKQISGANQSFNEYGDDSSPDRQSTRGGLNEKYTGENVKNSDINYNPNITTSDLNPYFVYGKASQVYGTDHPGYISRRNDEIASALYNEGKVSKEEVAQFLSSQNGFYNSSEADRLNTIEAVWKRLGAIADKNQPEQPEVDLSKAEDIVKDTSGKIYGKTTAEEGNPKQGIDTLADDNSVFNAINADRVKTTDDMYNVGVDNLAASKYYNTGAYSEQNWRDFSLRYPETAALVEQKVKEMKAQDTVNAVSNGTDLPSNTNTVGAVNNNIADFSNANATSTTSSAQITKNINTMLDNNQTAQTAQELMGTIEGEMATLKNRLKNLREEANSKFKGDAPEYLVNAYMNNKSQEIQNQLSILEDRYNAAYKRYTTEVSQAQWQQEFDLKKQQLKLQQDELALKEYQVKNGLSTTSSKSTSATKNEGDSFEVTTKTDEEVSQAVDTLYEMFDNGQLGNAQCAAGIQMYYLPMLGISLPNLSSIDRKKSLINEDKGYTPKRGDLIILNSKSSPSNGHIGIVLGVNNGYIEYMDWNGSLDANGNGTEKVAINSINSESQKILGFRNVNKGQGQTSGGWTEYDYTRFEQYRDATSKSEKETIAAEYGTDVQGMNNIVRDALENRPNGEQTSSTEELGYDDELGYNPYDKEIYDQIISDKLTLTDGAKKTGLSEQELRRRILNYQNARANGVDAYDDGSRNIDEKYGFNLDKKMVYQKIANMGGVIPGTQKATVLQELGLNPRDPNALKKALDETAKWQERQKQELDSQALDSLRAIEYIIMQDANRAQRLLAVNGGNQDTWYGAMDIFGDLDRGLSGEAASWDNSYKYIRDKLTLDYLVDLKNRGATFGALSNQELEAIGNAASLVMYTDETSRFKYNVDNLYNELRKALGYNELSQDELDKMWNAESSGNFDNYITLDHAHRTGWFGGDYGSQNIKPQRNVGVDMGNRRAEDNSGDGANVLNDVLNN